MGNWSYFAYDALRRKVAETNALGNVATFAYCACGSVDSITDPLNTTTHFYHDLAGNRIGTVGDGSWSSNRYDLLGRMTNRFDSAGTSVTNWYNHQGLLIAQSNNVGRVQTLLYDIEDRITNSVNADGIATGYRLDLLGRMDRRYPAEGYEEFEYSPRGLIKYVDLTEGFNYYGLDPAGRKIVETNNNSDVIGFRYNSAGQLTHLPI